MKDLYILGAGGFGRELFTYLHEHPGCGSAWRVRGFLDDNPRALDGYDYPAGIVAPISGFHPAQSDLFVNGLGLPSVKVQCIQPLLERGARFLTFVHPQTRIGRNVEIGQGTVICPEVILTADIRIGDFVLLNIRCSAGHDASVGSWSTLSGYCDITGFVKVGERVFMGTHACVIPGKSVANDAIVGAGAVVIRNVPQGKTVFGAPARSIK